MKAKNIIIALLTIVSISYPLKGKAQAMVHDEEKEKQWKSMENGPWDFAPDWYYYFLHGPGSNQVGGYASRNTNPTSSASCRCV